MVLNGQLYGLAAFHGRSLRYLLNESYFGPKSWSQYFGEAKNPLSLRGNKRGLLDSLDRNLVTITTAMSRLPFDRNEH